MHTRRKSSRRISPRRIPPYRPGSAWVVVYRPNRAALDVTNRATEGRGGRRRVGGQGVDVGAGPVLSVRRGVLVSIITSEVGEVWGPRNNSRGDSGERRVQKSCNKNRVVGTSRGLPGRASTRPTTMHTRREGSRRVSPRCIPTSRAGSSWVVVYWRTRALTLGVIKRPQAECSIFQRCHGRNDANIIPRSPQVMRMDRPMDRKGLRTVAAVEGRDRTVRAIRLNRRRVHKKTTRAYLERPASLDTRDHSRRFGSRVWVGNQPPFKCGEDWRRR